MTELAPGIHVYSMPMCAACQRWKLWLEMEDEPFVEHPLADLPADIGSSIPNALLESITARSVAGDSFLVAPTVLSVHPDGRVVLIAEGTEPLFWYSKPEGR